MDYTELGGTIADLNSADLGGQAKFISGPPQHPLTFYVETLRATS